MTATTDNGEQFLAKAAGAIEEMRTATRAAHEVLADLKAERRGLDQAVAQANAQMNALLSDVDGLVVEAVQIKLNEFDETIRRAITDSTKAVNARFEKLYGLLTGEGTDLDLNDLAEAYAVAHKPGVPRGKHAPELVIVIDPENGA
jgi:chromosome segregation ATPase